MTDGWTEERTDVLHAKITDQRCWNDVKGTEIKFNKHPILCNEAGSFVGDQTLQSTEFTAEIVTFILLTLIARTDYH